MLLKMGPAGLALSTSCVALTNFFLLLALMRRRIGRVEASVLLKSLARITLACAAMSVAAHYTHQLLAFNRYVNLAGSMAVALIVFGASCRLLRVAEFRELLGVLRLGAQDESQSKSPGTSK
jgi:peptidoglycan biosynthesis protein MviN/MurJ (putative lipid II flippase)